MRCKDCEDKMVLFTGMTCGDDIYWLYRCNIHTYNMKKVFHGSRLDVPEDADYFSSLKPYK